MLCNKCNHEITPGASFCTYCGAPVINENANNYAEQNTAENPYAQQASGNGYEQQYSDRYQYQQNFNAQPTPMMYPQYNTENLEHVSVAGWIGVLLLSCIPIANIVMLFVWGFSSTTKKSLKNYARAMLIFYAIAVVISIIAVIIFSVWGFSLVGSSYYVYH